MTKISPRAKRPFRRLDRFPASAGRPLGKPGSKVQPRPKPGSTPRVPLTQPQPRTVTKAPKRFRATIFEKPEVIIQRPPDFGTTWDETEPQVVRLAGRLRTGNGFQIKTVQIRILQLILGTGAPPHSIPHLLGQLQQAHPGLWLTWGEVTINQLLSEIVGGGVPLATIPMAQIDSICFAYGEVCDSDPWNMMSLNAKIASIRAAFNIAQALHMTGCLTETDQDQLKPLIGPTVALPAKNSDGASTSGSSDGASTSGNDKGGVYLLVLVLNNDTLTYERIIVKVGQANDITKRVSEISGDYTVVVNLLEGWFAGATKAERDVLEGIILNALHYYRVYGLIRGKGNLECLSADILHESILRPFAVYLDRVYRYLQHMLRVNGGTLPESFVRLIRTGLYAIEDFDLYGNLTDEVRRSRESSAKDEEAVGKRRLILRAKRRPPRPARRRKDSGPIVPSVPGIRPGPRDDDDAAGGGSASAGRSNSRRYDTRRYEPKDLEATAADAVRTLDLFRKLSEEGGRFKTDSLKLSFRLLGGSRRDGPVESTRKLRTPGYDSPRIVPIPLTWVDRLIGVVYDYGPLIMSSHVIRGTQQGWNWFFTILLPGSCPVVKKTAVEQLVSKAIAEGSVQVTTDIPPILHRRTPVGDWGRELVIRYIFDWLRSKSVLKSHPINDTGDHPVDSPKYFTGHGESTGYGGSTGRTVTPTCLVVDPGGSTRPTAAATMGFGGFGSNEPSTLTIEFHVSVKDIAVASLTVQGSRLCVRYLMHADRTGRRNRWTDVVTCVAFGIAYAKPELFACSFLLEVVGYTMRRYVPKEAQSTLGMVLILLIVPTLTDPYGQFCVLANVIVGLILNQGYALILLTDHDVVEPCIDIGVSGCVVEFSYEDDHDVSGYVYTTDDGTVPSRFLTTCRNLIHAAIVSDDGGDASGQIRVGTLPLDEASGRVH